MVMIDAINEAGVDHPSTDPNPDTRNVYLVIKDGYDKLISAMKGRLQR